MYPRKLDPDKCQRVVPTKGLRMDYHQCELKPWKDGYCKIHHPDTVKAKREEQNKAWQEKWDRERKQAERERACVNALRGLNPEAIPALVEEHKAWAKDFGTALLLTLQGDYHAIDNLAHDLIIDHVEGEPTIRSAALARLEASK